MTVALCTHCGDLKKGLLLPCDHCGEPPSKEISLEHILSDHYLSVDTLKEFGNVIKRLSMVANNKLEGYWAFMYLLSEYYPEIMFTDIPKVFRASSIILIKDMDLNPIVIKKGFYKRDKKDPESKFATVVDYFETNCPFCGVEKSVAIWRLFNGFSDAPLKRLLFEGRLFRSRCLKCHKVRTVHYDMVYFDIEPKPVLLFLDDPKSSFEYQINRVPKEYFDDLSNEFTCRKVERPIELIEKIQIFEDGLDDIEVELAKHYLSVDEGVDLTSRLHYHETKTSFFKKKQIVFRDRKNKLGLITYRMNNKRRLKQRLLTSIREKLNCELPVINHKTIRELLDE